MHPVLLAAGALIFSLGLLNFVAEHATWRAAASQDARLIIRSEGEILQTGGAVPHPVSGQQSLGSELINDALDLPKVARYHTVVTCDSSVYAQWQVRINYFHWKKLKVQEGPNSPVGGYTRLLHSGHSDGLMAEIPTVVVNPLPPDVPDGGYVVLHRPYGLLQWVQLGYTSKLEEEYILMAEPDHLFLALPRMLASPGVAASYRFSYMEPSLHANIINKYNTKKVPIADVYPVGNSPTMVAKVTFEEICPIWYDLAVKFKRTEETETAFGWILEMYAWSVASSQLEAGPLQYELHQELMAQPPWDPSLTLEGKPINILHYTYGQDCQETDGQPLTDKVGSWHFDKRDYELMYPPRSLKLPTKCKAPAMIAVVAMINEASAAIEPWQIERGHS